MDNDTNEKEGGQDKKGLKIGQYYRCRPTMSQANIIGPYLVELGYLNLQFFHLKDFTLYRRIPVLCKQDQYCAQLLVLNLNIVVIFGVDKFTLFDVNKMQITQSVPINSYIQKIQAKNNHVIILTSDEDCLHKIVKCWKIDTTLGKVQQKYQQIPFLPIDSQQCTDDNLRMTLLISFQGLPKIYIYWKDTIYLIEVDPQTHTSQKYHRHYSVSLIFDLTTQTYAQIVDKSIQVINKKTGKKIAQLVSQQQNFTQLFTDGSPDKIYSLSNLGLKKWKLQSNSTPSLYTSSQKQPIKKLFFTKTDELIGLNLQSNTVVIWKNPQQYSSYTFPNQVIRRIIKLNTHQVFFLLQATSSSQQQNQYHVTKYNKLQIYDFNLDAQISKKAMLKSQHSVDIDSVIINDSDTIRFIVNQTSPQNQHDKKKYILRWTPFNKDQNNKDTKKKQIKGSQSFNILKLYHFNKILGITLPKKSQCFSLFSKQQQKTQLVLFDFSAKKVGDYDLHGEINNAQLSQKNLMYVISQNRVFVYSIASEHKNRLQKIHQLDLIASSITPIGPNLLVKKQTSFILLDSDYECIVREQCSQNDRNYRVLPIDKDRFLLKTKTKLELWDKLKQQVSKIPILDCDPNVIEYIDGKLVIADNWVQVFDIKIS